ncbi:MAG: hypothetical protein EXR73_12630 [Myxococcales bacterium]|nr:hypothetical protein [Myxococcales bacterium]
MRLNQSIRLIVVFAALSTAGLTGCVVRSGHHDHYGTHGAYASTMVAVGPQPQLYVDSQPPALLYESIPATPYHGYVWLAGNWHWSGYEWTWVAGHWEAPRHGHVYIEPYYHFDVTYNRYVYAAGYWEHRDRVPGTVVVRDHRDSWRPPTGQHTAPPQVALPPPVPVRPPHVALPPPVVIAPPHVRPVEPARPDLRPPVINTPPTVRPVEPARPDLRPPVINTPPTVRPVEPAPPNVRPPVINTPPTVRPVEPARPNVRPPVGGIRPTPPPAPPIRPMVPVRDVRPANPRDPGGATGTPVAPGSHQPPSVVAPRNPKQPSVGPVDRPPAGVKTPEETGPAPQPVPGAVKRKARTP